jgi:hypothetical protein
MRYTVETVIDVPRDRAVAAFTDVGGFTQWQPGLESYKLVKGRQAQKGARARLTQQAGGRVIEMTETVESNTLPDALVTVYETDGVWNRSANRFIAESADTTRWVSDNEFRFTGFRRLLELLPGSFRKESLQTMERFKAFAESRDRT